MKNLYNRTYINDLHKKSSFGFSCLLVVSLLFLPNSSFSKAFLNWDQNSGQSGFVFAQNFQGARQNALGNGGSSLPTTDPLMVFLNPAMIESTPFKHHFSLSWQTGTLDRELGMLAWNSNFGPILVQSTVAWLAHDDIWGTQANAAEEMEETGVLYQPNSQLWMVTSVIPTTHFFVGVTAKWIRDHLSDDAGDQDAMALGFDWGIRPRETQFRWGWSLAMLDMGRQITAYTNNGVDTLALNSRLRASAHYRPAFLRGLTILLDTELPRYSPALVSSGLEWTVSPWVALRAGTQAPIAEIVENLKGNEFTGSTLLSWGSLGAGILWNRVTIDYSLSLLRDNLGQAHRISVRSGF